MYLVFPPPQKKGGKCYKKKEKGVRVIVGYLRKETDDVTTSHENEGQKSFFPFSEKSNLSPPHFRR
jgi:hypothetical protein